MLSFKSAFSLSSFTFIKRLLSSSLLSAIGGIIGLSEVLDISPGNLDSTCNSVSLAFRMMYSTYKLNKQGDNIQSWHTPFPILNQSLVLGGSYVITRVLRRGNQECQNEGKRFEEEEVRMRWGMGQGMKAVTRGSKKQGNRCSSTANKWNTAWGHTLDFCLQKCNIINLWWPKLIILYLHFWKLLRE